MNYMLDTHLLLWAASNSKQLSTTARKYLIKENNLIYSAASIWEIAIKQNLGRKDFDVDPAVLRRALQENGYDELPLCSEHAVAITSLPPIHRDPFDRILVGQATVEGITLLTPDKTVGQYPGPIEVV